MSERKVVSASHPYYVMDDGTLWRGSIGPTGMGGVQWTRIPGPPADPVAKAEGELPSWAAVEVVRPWRESAKVVRAAIENTLAYAIRSPRHRLAPARGGGRSGGEGVMPICTVCWCETTFTHDHKPDQSGLDDGPPLERPRKKLEPVAPDVEADRRRRAWIARRAKYGPDGHR